MIGHAESADGIVIRPVPEGFRTWLPAVFVLIGTPVIALMIFKFGLLTSMKANAVVPPVYAANARHDLETTPITFVRFALDDEAALAHSDFKNLALVVDSEKTKEKVEKCKERILNIAAVDLADTTVSDVDTPGAIDAKRAQLVEDINNALGGPVIEDAYLAERLPGQQ
jgi:hypothetical protein